MHAAVRADWSHASTFNLDEFAGVDSQASGKLPPVHAAAFFDGVNIQLQRASISSTAPPRTSTRSATATKRQSAGAGGIDLQVLGSGRFNGHIGFNEPADDCSGGMHRVRLMESTRATTPALRERSSRVPAEACIREWNDSPGPPNRAGRDGEKKAGIRQTVNGPSPPACPHRFFKGISQT